MDENSFKDYWVAWVIEQSLDSLDIFDEYKTIQMKSETDDWKEHILEIPGENLEDFIYWLKNNIKIGWYAHVLKNNEVWVIFRDKAFLISQGNDYSEIENYGISQGISKEQMDVEDLFVQACEEGFC